jgi:hypothetical protein
MRLPNTSHCKNPAFRPMICGWFWCATRAIRQDHAVLAARLGDRWLILDNRRAELIEDASASNFTPVFAIDHRGVHLFAAPYAGVNDPVSLPRQRLTY